MLLLHHMVPRLVDAASRCTPGQRCSSCHGPTSPANSQASCERYCVGEQGSSAGAFDYSSSDTGKYACRCVAKHQMASPYRPGGGRSGRKFCTITGGPSSNPSPTRYPTKYPTKYPTRSPTKHPTQQPTPAPTLTPTPKPTPKPTRPPTTATTTTGTATTATTTTHRGCGAGELREASTNLCMPCPDGTFRTETSHTFSSCSAHTPCGAEEFVAAPPTASTTPCA